MLYALTTQQDLCRDKHTEIKLLLWPQIGRSFPFLFLLFTVYVMPLSWTICNVELHMQRRRNLSYSIYGRAKQLGILLLQVFQFTRYLMFLFCPPSLISQVQPRMFDKKYVLGKKRKKRLTLLSPWKVFLLALCYYYFSFHIYIFLPKMSKNVTWYSAWFFLLAVTRNFHKWFW